MTLAEVPLLLADPGFRRRLVGRVDDPILQQFWGWFEGLSGLRWSWPFDSTLVG